MERYIMGCTNIEIQGYKYIYICIQRWRDTGIQIYIYIQRWIDIEIGEY